MYRNGDAGGYDADVCPAVGGTGGQRPVRRSPPCQGMQQFLAKFCMLIKIKMFKNVVVIMFIAIQLYLYAKLEQSFKLIMISTDTKGILYFYKFE